MDIKIGNATICIWIEPRYSVHVECGAGENREFFSKKRAVKYARRLVAQNKVRDRDFHVVVGDRFTHQGVYGAYRIEGIGEEGD